MILPRSILFVCAAWILMDVAPARADEPAAKTYPMEEVRVVASPIIQGNELDRYVVVPPPPPPPVYENVEKNARSRASKPR
jgi:hypothetical protein